ncbi:hypothetical protein ACWEIJ_36055 [Lentzea sp. NPDC004789]
MEHLLAGRPSVRLTEVGANQRADDSPGPPQTVAWTRSITAQVARGTRFLLGAGPRRPAAGHDTSREWIEAVAQAVLIARFACGLPVTWIEPRHTGRDVRLAWLKLFSTGNWMRGAVGLTQALLEREPESALLTELARACRFVEAISDPGESEGLLDGFLSLTTPGSSERPHSRRNTGWDKPDSIVWSPERISSVPDLPAFLARARPAPVVVDLPDALDRHWRSGLRALLASRSADGEVVFRCRGQSLLGQPVLGELADHRGLPVAWIVVLEAGETAVSFDRVASHFDRYEGAHRLGGVHLPDHHGGLPKLQPLLRAAEVFVGGR